MKQSFGKVTMIVAVMGHLLCIASAAAAAAFAPIPIVIARHNSLSSSHWKLTEPKNRYAKKRLYYQNEGPEEKEGPPAERQTESSSPSQQDSGWFEELQKTSAFFQLFVDKEQRKLPPLLVEDDSLLLYDVILILNLTASISFWVVHRMSFDYVAPALSEGSLMCILWIVSGLLNGSFLFSAVDGHYDPSDGRAGPKAAGMLGLHTFISASSLRVVLALMTAIVQHRPVGTVPGEDLMPLEIAFGLVLMSLWRSLHSSFTPRI